MQLSRYHCYFDNRRDNIVRMKTILQFKFAIIIILVSVAFGAGAVMLFLNLGRVSQCP